MGLSPKTYQRALEFGSIVHTLLEMWYNLPLDEELNLDSAIEAVRTERGFDNFTAWSMEQFEMDLYAIRGMVESYMIYYADDKVRYEILLAEKMLHLHQTFNGWRFRGVPDLVLKERNSDNIWVVDHKALSRISSSLLKKLPMDHQVHAYLKLVQEWLVLAGIEGTVRGVCYNICKKPTKRLKKNQTQDEYAKEIFEDYLIAPTNYFHREWVIVTEENMTQYDKFMDLVSEDMTQAHEKGRYKRNIYACDNYGECSFMELCLRGEEALYLYAKREHSEK